MSDEIVAKAVLGTPELPIEVRRQTLEAAAETPVARAKLLMVLTKVQEFDPERTAASIAPLLLELPRDAIFAINDDLDALLDSDTAGFRSAAVALKVKSGAPLGTLAERDPDALLDAITSLSEDQAPSDLANQLVDLAAEGKLDAGIAIAQANRLSADKADLFARLAELADSAMQLSFDQWGTPHTLAMAALAGMHQTADEDWPAGYDNYRIARADEETLKTGKEIYFYHDQGCYKCHGESGEGAGGFPPIAASPTLLGDPLRAATIVKHGLQGELPHTLNPADGKPFNAQMEPLKQFNDAELAAVLSYVRQSFGNFATPVTREDVAATRGAADGALMWQFADLVEAYPFERDRLTGSLPPPSIEVAKLALPPAGLWWMLGVVTASMLLILVGTYSGKYLHNPHTPTPA